MAGITTHKPIVVEWLKAWTPIAVTVVALIMAIAMWGARLETVEIKVAVQEVKIEELSEMRVQLAEMGRDIEWIRERLDRESH
jgi:hypothetical protein